jgi:hypothetical protein
MEGRHGKGPACRYLCYRQIESNKVTACRSQELQRMALSVGYRAVALIVGRRTDL